MARTTVAQIRESGWSFRVVSEHDDFASFTEEMLEDMRAGAVERMERAKAFVVSEVKRTLDRIYPMPTIGALKFRPAPPGAPPGKIEGELQESWKTGSTTWKKNKTILTGRVRSRHPAAGALEWGSPKQGIPAHPYYRPTLIRIEEELGAILEGSK